jgi:penicillin-insensitive murein endopeptidase
VEDAMLEVQPKDSRGYFMLPQAPEEAGYYVYGTPGDGAFQYAHPSMMTVILFVEREWAAIDDRKFGIGNISLAGGSLNKDHATHINGLEVDVRPVRKDGLHIPVTWHQTEEYDREATGKLIGLFFSYPFVKKVLFNDIGVYPGVTAWDRHDNHFHVEIRAPRMT